MDAIIGMPSACLVPDRRCAVLAAPLQKPEDLTTCKPQHVRAVADRQATIINLRKDFQTIEIALAHQHPSSHLTSLCRLLIGGEGDSSTLLVGDILALRPHAGHP